MNSARRYFPLAAALLLAIAAFWKLDGANPWWDEGWTLTVARTWVERGFYGRLLDGQLAPPGLEAAFPTTGLVALSFRTFGVGLWQGRLPIAMCAVAAMALLCWLACQFYDSRVAWATLFIALLTPVHPLLNPLLLGRQVMAEMPMLAFLLAGYACLLLSLKRSPWWAIATALFWAIGVRTKLQAVPFWAVSALVPLLLCLWQRRWRTSWLLGGTIAGSLLGAWLLPWFQQALLAGRTAPPETLTDLVSVTAFVPTLDVRMFALQTTFSDGLIACIGLVYALWHLLWREHLQLDSAAAVVRCSVLAFAGSWMLWFAGLSVGWERYMFPATFVASIFVGALLADLTQGFALRSNFQQLGRNIQQRRLNRAGAGSLLALFLLLVTLPLGVQSLYRAYAIDVNRDAIDTAEFLNSSTPPSARIETYESELFFFLQRPYHFPPDQLHVALNRQMVLKQTVPVHYDPLVGKPDVIVVGSFSRMWELYGIVPATPGFRLVRSFGVYDIYERINSF